VDTEVVGHVPVDKLQHDPSGDFDPQPAGVMLPTVEQVEPVHIPSIEISYAGQIGAELTNMQDAEWDDSGSDDGNEDGL
jgi:hypothetical protein